MVCSKSIIHRGLLHEEYKVNDVVQYPKDKELTSVAADEIDERDDAAETGEVAIEKVMGKEITLSERLNAYRTPNLNKAKHGHGYDGRTHEEYKHKCLEKAQESNSDIQSNPNSNESDVWLKRRATRWRTAKKCKNEIRLLIFKK